MQATFVRSYIRKIRYPGYEMADSVPQPPDPFNNSYGDKYFNNILIGTKFIKVIPGMRQQCETGFTSGEKVKLRAALNLAVNFIRREQIAHDKLISWLSKGWDKLYYFKSSDVKMHVKTLADTSKESKFSTPEVMDDDACEFV